MEETTINVASIDTVQTTPTNQIFGNAIITGSDVRMRAEPNLKGKIVTFFPEEGERVLLLQAANDSLNWAEIERENGTKGWVYGQYVKPDN
ncbi:MAG: SH3 domain-containing protein [Marinirhabdus sp.]|nr:SH3 domain-containing protein [Marinirhabdus sp.]